MEKTKIMEKNKKILLVEDDEDFLSILQVKFTSEGFTVVTAKNGEEGILVAEKEKPDLIFSDVLMPKVNGIEMAEKIKAANKDVPIIFLTNMKEIDYIKGVEGSGELEQLIKSSMSIKEIIDKAKNKLGIN